MENQSPEELQFQQNLQIANKAKEIYWKHYKELVENLSPEHLEEFASILKNEKITFDKEVLLKDFKENLYKDIIQSMEKSWQVCNIGTNLATLEMIKDKFKNHIEPNWRPYGKSVDEQTLHIRAQRLEAQVRYLRKQVDFQDAKLGELMQQNGIYRNNGRQMHVQRGFLREQMQRGRTQLQNLKAAYEDMIGQVLNED